MLSSLLFVAGAVYAGISLSLFLLQDRLVFYPTAQLDATPAAIGLDYEEVRVTTRAGHRLHGWFVPGPGERTVLFFHGNAGNISHRLESLAIFHRLGLSTFLFDYSGYGESEGSPSEAQTYDDAESAWSHLVTTRSIEPGRIVLFGRSLGGAVAAWLAARVTPAALIVESTFTSVPDMAAKLYPWLPVRLLARIRYDARAHVAAAHAPVLVAHSPGDEVVPYAHGRALYEAAPEPKAFLELRGGHNDGFIVTGEDYMLGLARFLETLPRG